MNEYVNPEVCLNKSKIVISLIAGIVFKSPGIISFRTFMFVILGMNSEILSSKEINPRSTKIMKPKLTIGLVIE